MVFSRSLVSILNSLSYNLSMSYGFVLFCFGEEVSVCCPGSSQTQSIPALASWELGLQAGTITLILREINLDRKRSASL